MERSSINPWTWSQAMGLNQAESVTGATRTVHCSGQTAMSDAGEPQHLDDIAGQVTASLDNLETVLAAAGMTLSDVVRLNVYTTDVEAMVQAFGVLGARLGAAGVSPATSLLGVTRLAVPGLLVELEATAMS